MIKIDNQIKKAILKAQRNEITEHLIYAKLSETMKDQHNKEILRKISNDELKHYNFWRDCTGEEVKPSGFKILLYYLFAKVFGLTFSIKLLEKGEGFAQKTYQEIALVIPEAKDIIDDEDKHENELIKMIDEERLRYVGSMVLGLNDALVELTGALAGFTLALQNTRLIALAGLITGIAASLSMGASEYLSTKTEGGEKNPVKASLYTGFAYIVTVIFLIFPYLLFTNYYFCLGFVLLNAVLVIIIFNFYISVAKDISFKNRFCEMVTISLGIAAVSFGIGFLIRILLKIDI